MFSEIQDNSIHNSTRNFYQNYGVDSEIAIGGRQNDYASTGYAAETAQYGLDKANYGSDYNTDYNVTSKKYEKKYGN